MSTPKWVTPKGTQEKYQAARTKFVAHALLADFVLHKEQQEKRPLEVLSLPGTSFQWEHMLHAASSCRIRLTGLESKPKVFQKGELMLEGLQMPMRYIRTTDLNFWKQEGAQKDVVWLDYCGPWSKLKAASVEAMFANRRLRYGNTGPLLALTLMDGMDFHTIGDLMMLADTKTKRFKARVGGIPRWIDQIARKHGGSAELKFLLHYRDGLRNPSATPMLLFVLQLHARPLKFDVWNAATMDLLQDRLANVTSKIGR